MGTITKIEWCHHTFNPWWGCTKVGEGCRNCYAESLDKWIHKGENWGRLAGRRVFMADHWNAPHLWNEAAKRSGERRRVFCGSMCDVLDEQAPEGELERLWLLIKSTKHLAWLLLSKRPERYRETFELLGCPDNIWAGASASTQIELDQAMEHLQGLDCRVRFLSLEPLIEPVSVAAYAGLVEWVIVGGESGPGARPCDVYWLDRLVVECCALDIPLFVKQLGAKGVWAGEPLKLSNPKGGDMGEWPAGVRVREVPV